MNSNSDYFPPYYKLYRTSVEGIKKPIPIIINHADAMVLVRERNMQMTYGNTKLVSNTSEMGIEYAVNKITYESFVDKKYFERGELKTMEDYLEFNKKKKAEIFEKIESASNYKDVGNWIKLDYISKDWQWFITKISRMLEYGSNYEAIQEFVSTDIGNILANIDVTGHFNLYDTSSYRGIQLMLDTFEYIKEMFEEIQWSKEDKRKIDSVFDIAISMIKSTNIYAETQTAKSIED